MTRHWRGHGTIQTVYLVLLLAAGAILAGVVVVAMGRGGEMAVFSRDLPVAFAPIKTPADVARLRLPMAPLGYQVQATADALTAIASLLAERDHEIAVLRSQIWRLESSGEPADDQERHTADDLRGHPGVSGPGELPGSARPSERGSTTQAGWQ
jgi:hypothetical protein